MAQRTNTRDAAARPPQAARGNGRASRPVVGPYFVYFARCADGTLYAGLTTDPEARERAHNAGRGARYTAGRRPVRLVYTEMCASRSAALKREFELKRMTRARKDAIIARAGTVSRDPTP